MLRMAALGDALLHRDSWIGCLLVIFPALVVYLLWVKSTRYSRIQSALYVYAQRHHLSAIPPLVRKLDENGKSIAPTRAEYPMTPAEAQMIVQMDSQLEFPFSFESGSFVRI